METDLSGFQIPPASMSAFEIISAAAFILIHRRFVDPVVARLRKSGGGLTEIERMGIGLIIAFMSMMAAGIVEHFRIMNAVKFSSGLSVFWQVPQYVFIGVSEIYMLVGQLEFFNGQVPDGLRSFGSALSMTSISLGNYASSLILTIVIKISTSGGNLGWIPRNLNKGHLDKFFYLLAAVTAADLVIYVACVKSYTYTRFKDRTRTSSSTRKDDLGNDNSI
ncbi:hypothetical protein OROGR_003982 [Orobanche gracilis]